jgi:putative lipase involved disintegration of autophagic bodies
MKNKENKIIEAYYGYIGEIYVDSIVDELEEKNEEIKNRNFPKKLDTWVEEYIKKEEKKEKKTKLIKNIKKQSKRAAIILLIIIAGISTLIFTVEAIRVRVFNYFIERNERYTEIRVEENEIETPELDWENYYQPTYMTEGYYFESEEDGGLIKILNYSDGKNQIIITQTNNSAGIQIDTEDATTENIKINGNEGFLTIKEDRSIIFWHNEEKSFTITGNIKKEEIVKIAESTEKIKK